MRNDDSLNTRLIYLHGFNSSPESQKAQNLIQFIAKEFADDQEQGRLDLHVPALPHKPARAIAMLENLIREETAATVLIGSSLGGFYSIYLAQDFPCKVILINPLVTLQHDASTDFLGKHINPYSGETFEIVQEDAEALGQMEVTEIKHQENYFLLLESGDQVLDYRLALEKLPQARHKVIQGGSHRFDSFAKLLPEIMQFAGFSLDRNHAVTADEMQDKQEH
tara:strand:+ start:1154 stop:1822 length:669 start_codon:yes stop_codon:yes gene_type:complete